MQVVRQLDEGRWREFVENHPQGNIFHTPEMFRVFAQTQGHQPALWAAVDGRGCPLALFVPVQISLLDGPLRLITTRTVAYGSVLCAPGWEGERALDLLLKTYNRSVRGSVLFTEMRNMADLNGLQPVLKQQGFVYEEHLNFLINLQRPPTEIWGAINANARRNVKKAIRSDVVVEEIEDKGDIPAVYAVLKEVYKRIQVPLPDQSLFEAAYAVLRPREMINIFIAKVDGVATGALTLLRYKGVLLYWYTGTLRDYSAYRPADLLVWHALEHGSRTGCHLFDFGGGGRPDEEYGVRDFKAKFGGELVNFGRNVRVHAPLRLQLSQKGYQMVRGLL